MIARIAVVAASAALAVPMLAGAASASHTDTISDNANNNACFGQWRAATADGAVFASRKGANATHNVSDKAYCAHS